MLNHNFLTYGGKIVLQIIGEILYFPVWWYSVGLGRLIVGLAAFWRGQEESLGWSVWAKNIFVPMYGQLDIASRVISFVMRLVQVILRGAALLSWFVVLLLILIIWLSLPLAIFLALAWQLAH
jgi:hypothetical protein